MPRSLIYQIALIFLFVIRLVLLNTGFVEWLWYQHFERAYYALAELRVQLPFLNLIGGWKLPVYIVFILCWWHLEESDEAIPAQFLLVPLGYVPFSIIADMIANGGILPDNMNFYFYPLCILTVGYVYIFIWTALIWVLTKIGLVIS